MSLKRNAGMAVAVTAGVAGALMMSALPAQAQPGDRGGNGGNGGGFAVSCGFSHSASADPIVMPGPRCRRAPGPRSSSRRSPFRSAGMGPALTLRTTSRILPSQPR